QCSDEQRRSRGSVRIQRTFNPCTKEDSWNPCCWTPPAIAARRRPCLLHRGRPPRNKGEQYPADPPTVEEIVSVMRTIGDGAGGHRLRALIVLLWRVGLRLSVALAPQEGELD